ncbi:MAG: hypothetical protein DYG89_31540 [Caldilinea sp. CFX5]|nr:hypothetical protein [Caldilinea sp. CFX5]
MLRVNVAVYRCRIEELSVAKAAAIAGVSLDRMKEILSERTIPLHLGPETMEEAYAEIDAAKLLKEDHNAK